MLGHDFIIQAVRKSTRESVALGRKRVVTLVTLHTSFTQGVNPYSYTVKTRLTQMWFELLRL